MSLAYADEVLADSPLFYLRLGESSGLTAVDASPNGHNFTYGAAAVLGVAGALSADPDTALEMDGTSASRASGGDWDVVGSQITLECWAKPDVLGVTKNFVAKFNSGSDVQGALSQRATDKYGFSTTTGGVLNTLESVTAISTAAYRHIVGTYDGTTKKIYVDGVLDNSVARTGSLANNAWTWAVGSTSGGAGTAWYDGRVDEVAVYASCLSAARVLAHYDARLVAPGGGGAGTKRLRSLMGVGLALPILSAKAVLL